VTKKWEDAEMDGKATLSEDGKTRSWRRFVGALAVSVLTAGLYAGLAAQSKPIPEPTPPAANADKAAMADHFNKARLAAGTDLYMAFQRRCIIDAAYARSIAGQRQEPALMEPVKVFDNLYFVGQNAVSSWALKTSEGFIIIDTLNNSDEAKNIIVGGFVKLGLNPKDIKYVLLTHEHGDHFAGAPYLRDTFGARLIASKIAWDNMAAQAKAPARQAAPAAPGQAPAAAREGGPPAEWAKLAPLLRPNDIAVVDGQTLKIGDTPLTFYVTPGHADGAVNIIFATTDNGTPHMVAFYGGFGSVRDPVNQQKHMESMARMRKVWQAAGVDVQVGNHQTQDNSVDKLEILKFRRAGDPNPFVLGKDAALRRLDVEMECTRYVAARAGQTLK
jgi:metallo-beta-lactamase class B